VLDQESSGNWTHYDYVDLGYDKRIDAVQSAYANYTYDDYLNDNSLCRETEYSYTTEDSGNDDGTVRTYVARRETAYILGHAVTQTKRVLHKDGTTGVVDWIKEYRMAVPDGQLTDTHD